MVAALIIFAKEPVAGFAKTRMIPALGEDGAAALARHLLAHTLQQADAFATNYRELCVATVTGEMPKHGAFGLDANRADWRLTMQIPGDLGQRMLAALVHVLSVHPRVLLMGTDAPALDTARLQQAEQALMTHDAVFVPTFDGGYALVGLRSGIQSLATWQSLFVDMPWSTGAVMAETRKRAQQAGLRWAELAPIADLDEPADLLHAPAWLNNALDLSA